MVTYNKLVSVAPPMQCHSCVFSEEADMKKAFRFPYRTLLGRKREQYWTDEGEASGYVSDESKQDSTKSGSDTDLVSPIGF